MTTEEFVASLSPEQAKFFMEGLKTPPKPKTDEERNAEHEARMQRAKEIGQAARPWLNRVGLMGLGGLIAGGIAYATGAVDPFDAAMKTAKSMK